MTLLVGIAVLHMLHQCGYNYLFVATAWLYVISHHFDPEGCCDQSCDHHQQLRAREDVPGQNPRWGGGGKKGGVHSWTKYQQDRAQALVHPNSPTRQWLFRQL